MAIKVNGISVISDSRKGEFRSSNPGRYTETERDNLSPSVGDIVFNTTASELQVWDGTEWASAGGASMIIEQEDFAYEPVSNAVVFAANTADNTTPSVPGHYRIQELTPGEYFFVWAMGDANDLELRKIQAGDSINFEWGNGISFDAVVNVGARENTGSPTTSWYLNFQYPDVTLYTTETLKVTSPRISNGTKPLEDGDIMVYDISTEKWTASSGGSIGSAPAANSATLRENDISGFRFTSQDFTTEVEMFQEGQPVSTKSIKGKITADFPVYPETNPIEAGITSDTTPTYLQNTTRDGNSWLNEANGSRIQVLNVYDPNSNKVRDFLYIPSDNNNDASSESSNNMESFSNYIAQINNNSQDNRESWDLKVNRAETHANFWTTFDVVASLDLNNFLLGNETNTVRRYGYYSTTKYEYEVDTNKVMRRPFGTNDSWQSRSISNQYGNWPFINVVETSPDAIVLAWKDDGDPNNRIRYYTLTDAKSDSEGGGDAWSNNNSITSDFTVEGPDLREAAPACHHKGATFWGRQEGIGKLVDGQNQMLTLSPPPPPQNGQEWNTGDFTLWEEPLTGQLVCRAIFYNYDTTRRHYYYYGSNNSGATWTPDFYPTISRTSSDPSAIGSGYMENTRNPDKYSYGRRMAMMRQNGIASAGYASTSASIYTIALYDVTVNDGADLDQINVDDIVKTSNVTNPYDYFRVVSITNNGNGTTTLKLSGFGTPVEGSTLQTTSSTGNAPLSKWLVIGASGNIASLTAIEPEYVAIGPSTSVPITFPAQFPTGTSPDDELPNGTSIQTFIKTENASGASEVVSNIVVPGQTPAPTYTFGLTAFSINNNEPDQEEEYKIKWISDSCGFLGSSTNESADGIWRSQQYYTDKGITNNGCLEGFKNNYIRNSRPNNMDFTFNGLNLQDKVLVFGLYGTCGEAQGSSLMISNMTTSTSGVSIYENGSFEVSYDGFRSGMFEQKLKVNAADVTSIDVNFQFDANSSGVQQNDSSLQLLYWRLEDLAGNELPTVKP